MTEPLNAVQAQAALADARTTGAMLQSIATQYPALWPLVAAHPNAYEGLLDWLDEVGDAQVRTVVMTRRARSVGVLPYGMSAAAPGAPAYVQPAPQPAPAQGTAAYDPGADQGPPTFTRAGGLEALFGPSAGTGDDAPEAPAPRLRRAAGAAPRAWRPQPWMIAVGAVVAVLVIALIVWLALRGRTTPPVPPGTSPTASSTAPGQVSGSPGLADAQAAFTAAEGEFTAAQDALTTAIAAGTTLVQNVPEEQVTDPAVLKDLATALTVAKAAVTTAPAPAANASDLAAQTAALQQKTTVATQATTQLTAATQAVQAGRIGLAGTMMDNAIAAAQTAYDDSADPLSKLTGTQKQTAQAAQADLATKLETAKTVAAGLASADPTTVYASAKQWVTALADASNVLAAALSPTCANGMVLPAGTDQRVCSGMPAGATALAPTTDAGGWSVTVFQTPSGNIGCTRDAYGAVVVCEISRHTWTMPAPLHTACGDDMCTSDTVGLRGGVTVQISHGDVPPWSNLKGEGVTAPTLPYGSVADFGQAACLSSEAGVTCWDVDTHHGFRIASQALVYW